MVSVIVEDEAFFTNKYYLIATVNLSCSLNRGHFWAFIKDLHSTSCYSCNNDKLVSVVEQNSLNDTASYVFILLQILTFSEDLPTILKGF